MLRLWDVGLVIFLLSQSERGDWTASAVDKYVLGLNSTELDGTKRGGIAQIGSKYSASTSGEKKC